MKAHNILDKSAISVDKVAWNPAYSNQQFGCFQDTLHQAYWFEFTALTTGTFEFALHPKNKAADYDFILFANSCPCDTSTKNIVACNWLGWVNQLYGSTGISNDPYTKFNVTDTIAWAEFERTIIVTAGVNYYLLVDNISNNGVGFDLNFGGTAMIGKSVPELKAKITAIDGNTQVCSGTKVNYEVKSNLPFSNYEWVLPKDAVIVKNGNKAEITWGKTGGKLKVIAAKDCQRDSISVDIIVNQSPDLKYIDKRYFCKNTCFSTKGLQIEDLNLNPSLAIQTYSQEADAWQGTFQNYSEEFICKPQTFYIRATTLEGCFDTLKIEIKEQQNPSIVLLGGGVACPGDSANLGFSFTGIAPYEFSYTDGSQTFTITTSQQIYTQKIEIRNATTFSVSNFKDQSNLCKSSIIGEAAFFTPPNCACLKRAGTMDPLPIEVCGSGIANAKHNADHSSGPKDTLAFILHSTNSPELGTVYASAATPQFPFSMGLMYDKVYYIASVLGLKKADGTVDLTDPCLGISAGVPVRFHKLPEIELVGDTLICKGAQTTLAVKPSGIGPFSIDLLANGTINQFKVQQAFSITGITTGIYIVRTITDANNCAAQYPDTITINNPVPLKVSNKKTICNFSQNSYYVTFDVSGGERASYYTIGQKGAFSGSSFKSENYAFGQTHFFMVKDANNCDSVLVAGKNICDCVDKSNPGTMNPDSIVICASFSATASYNYDQKLEAGHVLGFVLKDKFGSILSYNKLIPGFKMEPGMQINTAYYISAVAGMDDGTGRVQLNSTCTTFSNAVPIYFVQEPSVEFLSNSQTICQGTSTDLSISLSGLPGFSVQYLENSTLKTISNISANQHSFSVFPSKTSTYLLNSIVSGARPGCRGTIGLQKSVTITVVDSLKFANLQIKCSADKKNFSVAFDLSGGDNNFSINGTAIAGNTYESPRFSDGASYNFVVESGMHCKPLLISGRGFCSCPPDATLQLNIAKGILCHNENSGEITALTTLTNPVFQWSTGSTASSISNLYAGKYYVSVADDKGCVLGDSAFLLNPLPISAQISVTNPKCYLQKTGSIALSGVTGGTSPYEFRIDSLPFGMIATFKNLAGGSHLLQIKDNNNCIWREEKVLQEAEPFVVGIGTDKYIRLGDEITISSFISAAYKDLNWNVVDSKSETISFVPVQSVKVLFEATNDNDCKAETSLMIYVDKTSRVYVPNSFSPNGDGTNDFYSIFSGTDVSAITNFHIIDRWGTLIFERSALALNDETSGWDGQYKGQAANTGNYIFTADIHFIDGRVEKLIGDVYLKSEN
ncbi:MAG: T9SS type B sorting domain-containing protein [Saprospiraceae bacterium]